MRTPLAAEVTRHANLCGSPTRPRPRTRTHTPTVYTPTRSRRTRICCCVFLGRGSAVAITAAVSERQTLRPLTMAGLHTPRAPPHLAAADILSLHTKHRRSPRKQPDRPQSLALASAAWVAQFQSARPDHNLLSATCLGDELSSDGSGFHHQGHSPRTLPWPSQGLPCCLVTPDCADIRRASEPTRHAAVDGSTHTTEDWQDECRFSKCHARYSCALTLWQCADPVRV